MSELYVYPSDDEIVEESNTTKAQNVQTQKPDSNTEKEPEKESKKPHISTPLLNSIIDKVFNPED